MTDTLPLFSKIKPEDITKNLDEILQKNTALLENLLSSIAVYKWDNLLIPLDKAENELARFWSPIYHLNHVMNNANLREAYQACLPKLSQYHTELGQNKQLFQAINSIYQQRENFKLDQAQIKVLENALRGFKLSGINLPNDKQRKYKKVSQKLSKLNAKFSDNVLDATNHWFKHITDKQLLSGLPQTVLDMAKQMAKQRELSGWVFTLAYPSYNAVVTYADNEKLRQEIYYAYVTRASELGEKTQWDNSKVMRKIQKLRQQKAHLLGFDNYAELSLYNKMADSPTEVIDFLQDLATKSKPFAQQELKELTQYAEESLGLKKLQVWDIAYVSEKLKQSLFEITNEMLKPYFPVNQVLKGLFDLVETLYEIKITEIHEGIDLWHPDVRFFQIHDKSGQLRAEFYLDLYARPNKRGGAWMDDFCNRFKMEDTLQIPIAFMICNSAPPIENKPALFTHNNVMTLFHEFGHGLQHMLTTIDYIDISGISGIEWDAVELASQFMENWCWQNEVLSRFAKHYETKEALPKDLLKKMQAAKDFQAGIQMLRQIEFALFDMRLHLDHKAYKKGKIEKILQQTRKEVSVIEATDFNRFTNSFSHIFAGGYAAGYYSYKWAEVLSADAFSRFEKEGLFNPKVGQSFLQEILETGGSRHAMASFVAFRGRKPNIEALLRHSGLNET